MLNAANFTKNLTLLCPDPEQKKFLLAISGGADSMVLAHLFLESKLNFQVAHINYGLRGEDSENDQKVVENFCKKNGIRFHLYKVSDAEKPDKSVQIWARKLRYDFFFNVLREEQLEFIATAHHLNDELETFFINLSRGSGIRGLSGIPKNENQILRPLLSFTKQEIYDFAEEKNICFREDLSNKKNDYLRNKIRNKIIPEIADVMPDFLTGFQNSIKYLNSANSFIQNEIETKFSYIKIKESATEFTLDRQKLFALHPYLINEIFLKLGFRGDEIQKITSAENGKMFRSKTHEIYIYRTEIICKM